MIGGIIGGGLKAAGAIFGGIKASQAMRDVKRNIEAQRKKNQDWYDQRYNEDATQRADAQRVLTQLRDDLRQRTAAASGAAAVMGGSEESAAAMKSANNAAVADATSRIAADADAKKDRIEATYLQNDNAFAQQLNELNKDKAMAIAGAAEGVAGAASDIADVF